jgi:hypothetical protein
MSESETLSTETTTVTAPIVFAALDRYYATTYINTKLSGLSDAVKTPLLAALAGIETLHPVRVAIPAPPATPGAPAAPANDPLLPASGAFAIHPFQFVKV